MAKGSDKRASSQAPKYQSMPSKFGGAIVMAIGIIMGLSGAIVNPSIGAKLAYGIGGVLLTVAGYRYGESSVTVSNEGVAIRNPLSSHQLRWGEIQRFDVGRCGIEPAVCLVHRVDGSAVPAYGVTERGSAPNGSARQVTDELNRELVQHAAKLGHATGRADARGSAQEAQFRSSSPGAGSDLRA